MRLRTVGLESKDINVGTKVSMDMTLDRSILYSLESFYLSSL